MVVQCSQCVAWPCSIALSLFCTRSCHKPCACVLGLASDGVLYSYLSIGAGLLLYATAAREVNSNCASVASTSPIFSSLLPSRKSEPTRNNRPWDTRAASWGVGGGPVIPFQCISFHTPLHASGPASDPYIHNLGGLTSYSHSRGFDRVTM